MTNSTSWRYTCGHIGIEDHPVCPTCKYAGSDCPIELVRQKTYPATAEMVNHPQHYGGADNPYEVIKVARAWLSTEELIGALKFQIIKYTPRAGKKPETTAAQDIAKAAWYVDYLAKFLKEKGL